MKLVESIDRLNAENYKFFSLEFFPVPTERGRNLLLHRIEALVKYKPLFVSISSADTSQQDYAISLAETIFKLLGVDVLLYVYIDHLSDEELISVLHCARSKGLQNICLVFEHFQNGNFSEMFLRLPHLMKIIREKYEHFFCIGMTMNLAPDNKQAYFSLLKKCTQSTIRFFLTDLVFKAEEIEDFLEEENFGVPIIPMIPVLRSNDDLHRSSLEEYLGRNVPQQFSSSQISKSLLNGNLLSGIQLSTFNIENETRDIVIDLKTSITELSYGRRRLPWVQSLEEKRVDEEVRPIFWANRPKSYFLRTSEWKEDDFSRTKKWGVGVGKDVPELQEIENHKYFDLVEGMHGSIGLRRKIWKENLDSEYQVYEVFANYIRGDIDSLPWCETSLHLETSIIKEELIQMNLFGFLTINSQPRVNGHPSHLPPFGWGPSNGYVYQKAYIEFFCRASLLKSIQENIGNSSLTYHAVNHQGELYSNSKLNKACAVTWGVFPNREVIQPTIVDKSSFLVWKDEAFNLWMNKWAAIYPEKSDSYDIIEDIFDSYFLVYIVDNDYINGDIFSIFRKIMKTVV